MNSSNFGPRPLFDEGQVRRALELIGEHEPIGRKKLAEKLGIGEGSMRTILNRLKEKGLITSTARGHVLTDKGDRELGERSRKFLEIDVGDLTVGKVSVATMVKDAIEKVRRGIEQRDEAIKVGAQGATTLVYRDEDLELLCSETQLDKEIKSELLEFFQPSENDIIVIGTADSKKYAERGALAAAESLSD
ncbi:hypothetical protein AKJ40_00020 [candidate division MSBL1 archaeon SCGC-AAA259M10]|uniref:Uncharacterized protein n=3 Tax=candidate division MSBL1 TaxID=215777 RepID=A0A133U5S7_9EURY|nr:hypothetical protein AKJ62_02885 [candidate division MSBL1 archaeon SCGC-AAA259D14]KXA94449.1 hypothetical protein AKJ36_02880 [candidate division MSBL1 archaeon SCGC-AAA259I07]KXB00896.1 hypothetical protein AKJ40_00020 [candidate division MSBL1 archaeon SCGC-AAA259M10]